MNPIFQCAQGTLTFKAKILIDIKDKRIWDQKNHKNLWLEEKRLKS